MATERLSVFHFSGNVGDDVACVAQEAYYVGLSPRGWSRLLAEMNPLWSVNPPSRQWDRLLVEYFQPQTIRRFAMVPPLLHLPSTIFPLSPSPYAHMHELQQSSHSYAILDGYTLNVVLVQVMSYRKKKFIGAGGFRVVFFCR